MIKTVAFHIIDKAEAEEFVQEERSETDE